MMSWQPKGECQIIDITPKYIREFLLHNGADKTWNLDSPKDCIIAHLLREAGAYSVWVGASHYTYWIKSNGEAKYVAGNEVPGWYCDLCTHFTYRDDDGRAVLAQDVISYIDTHHAKELSHD